MIGEIFAVHPWKMEQSTEKMDSSSLHQPPAGFINSRLPFGASKASTEPLKVCRTWGSSQWVASLRELKASFYFTQTILSYDTQNMLHTLSVFVFIAKSLLQAILQTSALPVLMEAWRPVTLYKSLMFVLFIVVINVNVQGLVTLD